MPGDGREVPRGDGLTVDDYDKIVECAECGTLAHEDEVTLTRHGGKNTAICPYCSIRLGWTFPGQYDPPVVHMIGDVEYRSMIQHKVRLTRR